MYRICAKKLIVYLLAGAMTCCLPSYADDLEESQSSFDQALGICAADGMSTGVAASMMGWGLAIIVGITILAIVLHQSTSTSHSGSSSSSGTAAGTSTANPGLGSVI